MPGEMPAPNQRASDQLEPEVKSIISSMFKPQADANSVVNIQPGNEN